MARMRVELVSFVVPYFDLLFVCCHHDAAAAASLLHSCPTVLAPLIPIGAPFTIAIMSKTRFGTFDDLVENGGAEQVALARQLRELLRSLDPNTTETVRLGDRAATYGIGPRKMKEGYCYIMLQQEWVNLGFYQGGVLDDPAGLLEGTGKKMRHIKVRSAAMLEDENLRQLVRDAVAERLAANGRA